MPGMEIFLRAPQMEQTARAIAQSSQQAASGAKAAAAAPVSGPGYGAATTRMVARSLGVSEAEAAKIVAGNKEAAARFAGVPTPPAEPEDEKPGLLEKAMSNLFGRRARLVGMGGVNPSAILSRLGAVLEEVSPAAAGAAAGLVAVAEGTKIAVQRISELGAAATTSGGTGRQVALLAGLGIDPSAITGRAMALRQRLASDPYAISTGISLGIGPQLPMPFGSQNVAATYVKALEGLRTMGEGEEQLRRARMLGLEADLALINTSERYWNQTKAIAGLQAEIASPGNIQATRDLSSAWENLKTSALMAGEALAKPVVPVAAEGFKDLAGAISVITKPVNDFTQRLQTEARALGAISSGFVSGDWREFWRVLNGYEGGAQKEHADAMREHSRLLREGVYGGGERARGAVPSALRGQMLRDAMDGNNVTFGAWSV